MRTRHQASPQPGRHFVSVAASILSRAPRAWQYSAGRASASARADSLPSARGPRRLAAWSATSLFPASSRTTGEPRSTGTASACGCPPAGTSSPNEDPIQAVLREIEEETGVEALIVPTSTHYSARRSAATAAARHDRRLRDRRARQPPPAHRLRLLHPPPRGGRAGPGRTARPGRRLALGEQRGAARAGRAARRAGGIGARPGGRAPPRPRRDRGSRRRRGDCGRHGPAGLSRCCRYD